MHKFDSEKNMHSKTSHTTLLEAVRKSLEQAGRSALGDAVAPAAFLWANYDAQWQSLIDQFCPQIALRAESQWENRK